MNYMGFNVKLASDGNYIGTSIPSVRLFDVDDGTMVAKVTVNIPNYNHLLLPKHFFCHNYSENDGMADWLIENGCATMLIPDFTVGPFNCSAPIMKWKDGLPWKATTNQ